MARQENLDGCDGKFFAAHLAVAKGQYENALTELNEVLKQRPLFSLGFLVRGTVNAVIGNEHASIDDIRRASYLNPLDGKVAKALASY